MQQQAIEQRLSQIATVWTILLQGNKGAGDADTLAQAAVLERYQSAAYRYLLGAVRDPDAADELFQEFALRFVRGDFRRADPERGRFRDFVKTALRNLATSYHEKTARHPAAFLEKPEDVAAERPPDDLDAEFLSNWRKALLDRAWESLAALEKPGGPPFHTVLRIRSEQPHFSSAEAARVLTAQLRPTEPFTDAGLRKVLQRARDMFADLLVDEVARSLRTSDLDRLEQEVIDLGLQAYCRRALQRRRDPSA
jgi:RNA polymerase sigma-70 factor (ECF subfamily)